MFVGIVTPPLIIANSLSMDFSEKSFFIGMALFASGVTTYFQVRRAGPVGSGLLCVQGTSFTFVEIGKQAGAAGGLPLILGLTLVCSSVEMAVSRFIRQARRLFPPVVMGTVITLIGMSLIPVGFSEMAGGAGAADFGAGRYLCVGFLVLATILAVNSLGRGIVKMGAIACGIAVGYLVCIPLGMIDFTPVAEAGWLTVPRPVRFGFSLRAEYLAPWILAYLITSIESMGDLTATMKVSRLPLSGEGYVRRISGGVLADGLGSAFAGLFNSLPNTTFSQNIGVIQFTGVASRRVGIAAAFILAGLGLLPKFAAAVGIMPSPVLGGATITMFGLVAMAGLKTVFDSGMTYRTMLILSVSLSLGLGVIMAPEALARVTPFFRPVFSSGMITGALAAVCLNLLLPSEGA